MRLVLSLRTWLLLSHLAVLTLPVLALMATGFLARSLQDQAREHLLHEGRAIAALAGWPSASEDAAALSRLNEAFVAIARETGTRLWLVDGDGLLRVSSETEPLGVTLADASVQGALQGQDIVALRGCGEPRPERCEDGGLMRVVVATPILVGGSVQGAILLSAPPAAPGGLLRSNPPALGNRARASVDQRARVDLRPLPEPIAPSTLTNLS